MMQENVYFEGGNFKNLQHLRGAHPPSDSPLRRTSKTTSALRADRAPSIKTGKSRHWAIGLAYIQTRIQMGHIERQNDFWNIKCQQ